MSDQALAMELLTVVEAAQVLKVSAVTVRRRIADGSLKALKVGKGVRVRRESVDQFAKPITPAVRERIQGPRGRPTSADDPLWRLVGIADSAGPGDVSENKHRYLADAYLHRSQDG